MDWEKVERIGIALSIIALAVLGCLVVSPPWTEADADEGLFTVILILEHYDCETGVRHRYVKTGDLLLKNFAILIADSFRGAAPLIKVTTTSENQKTPYWYYGGGVDYLAILVWRRKNLHRLWNRGSITIRLQATKHYKI